ncbi:hypothetical protein AB0D62_32645 [Streptomyces massasporeus]|uniref:hypothetical protein n=1 Tax=Streptomyces massasporeus TaxID=67324 RepID=UPI0034097347
MNTQRTGGAGGRAVTALCHTAGGRAHIAGAGDTRPPRARAPRIAAGVAGEPGTRSGTPAGAVGGAPGAARRHPACEP